MEQAAQRSCGCPIPGCTQGQVGWGLGQLSWWGAALPMAEVETRRSLRSLPNKTTF